MNIVKSRFTRINRVWRILVLVIFLMSPLMPSNIARAAVAKKVGLVTDMGGVNDNYFNWLSYQGLLRSETQLGITKSLYEPASSNDYATALQQCANANDLCIAVGWTMGDAINTVAVANPGTKFAILDYSYESTPTNLRGITFNAKQVGYLAGTLAGKMTKNNAIGVIGGMNIPPVAAFTEGYRNGAQCANPNVNVLTTYTNAFDNPSLGAATAQKMIAQRADVIFGAAGPTGNGAILYSAQHNVWSIGVDTDQYVTVFGNGTVAGHEKLLTSAMKRLDNAVYLTIQDIVNTTFTSGTVQYNLSNNGVGLAPYHDATASIPTAVKTYVTSVKQGIINGTTNIDVPCFTTTSRKYNSIAAYDGWVLESTETSGVGGTMNAGAATFNLGDDAANKQYRGILHFDTSALPDTAKITSVTLKIKKSGSVGTTPFATHGGLLVDIRKPFFGASATLAITDFQAAPTKPAVAAFGVTPVSNWYSAYLNGYGIANINKLGTTQFRLRFTLDDNNDHGADYMSFFSGNSILANRPQLIILYYIP